MPLRYLLSSPIPEYVSVELIVQDHASQVIALDALLEVGLAVDTPVELAKDILWLNHFFGGVACLHIVRETSQFLFDGLIRGFAYTLAVLGEIYGHWDKTRELNTVVIVRT